MFRNGISIVQRPLWRQLAAHSKLEVPFVCTACLQARALASHSRAAVAKGARKGRLNQDDGMLEQIKRLEAHVRLMERSYVEQLRKRAMEKVGRPRSQQLFPRPRFFFLFFFSFQR